jgi:two-component system, response regulator
VPYAGIRTRSNTLAKGNIRPDLEKLIWGIHPITSGSVLDYILVMRAISAKKGNNENGACQQDSFPQSSCRSVRALEIRKTRVLIVEDDPDGEALLLRELQKTQLHEYVKVIADGKQATEYLTNIDAHCEELVAIFLDLSLTTNSGLMVLESVRSNDRIRHLPVIVMTSSNSSAELEECEKMGVLSFVQKPITFKAFTKAIADTFHAPLREIEYLPKPLAPLSNKAIGQPAKSRVSWNIDLSGIVGPLWFRSPWQVQQIAHPFSSF